VAPLPGDVQERLLAPPNVTVRDLSSGREFSQQGVANIVLPFVASFLFFFATMMASGTMLEVVAEEKENRTMEIVATSITPGQLIGGKTVGLLASALTQLAIYALSVIVGVALAAPHVPAIQQLQVPWGYLGLMALFFFPAYGLVAAIMITLGSAVTELQQGQQVSGLLSVSFTLPLFILPVIFENPGHPLAVALTLFPTTSFLTVSLRWGLGSIPVWQIGLGWAILVGSVLAMVWVATRVFRASMLRYGQPLSWKSLVSALRG
jgi:ABC-2 type transport system permease protein